MTAFILTRPHLDLTSVCYRFNECLLLSVHVGFQWSDDNLRTRNEFVYLLVLYEFDQACINVLNHGKKTGYVNSERERERERER